MTGARATAPVIGLAMVSVGVAQGFARLAASQVPVRPAVEGSAP